LIDRAALHLSIEEHRPSTSDHVHASVPQPDRR
jgi:hypothetical protein